MTSAPTSPPAEADEQQIRVLSCTISDLEVDEDGFEVKADGSSLSDEEKAEDSRQEAVENAQQAKEAKSPAEQRFYREQVRRRRAEAFRFERRRNQPINTSPAPRRSGHRRAPGARPVHQSGSRRTSSSSGDSDDGESAPPRGRPHLRHISEATRPLLRGWLDRFNRTAVHAGLEPHERLELFLALPAGEQADRFAQLGEHERRERVLDGDVEWPKPQIAAKLLPTVGVPTWVPARRHRDHDRRGRDDVLDTISPRDYWPALTGEEVPASGRVHCPAPGHEDVNPSCVVYSNPGRGWWCPVCGAGGTAIDLAAILTGIEPRGEGFWRLREWIAERLLNAPIVGRAA